MKLRTLAFGFVFASLAWSAIGMTLSLLMWQGKGCVEWGIAVIVFGVTVKTMVDKL